MFNQWRHQDIDARQDYEKQKGPDMLKSIFPTVGGGGGGAGPDETNTKDHSTSSTISSMFGTIQNDLKKLNNKWKP